MKIIEDNTLKQIKRETENPIVVVVISADIEWREIKLLLPLMEIHTSPFGEWSDTEFDVNGEHQKVTFVQGGWGKIAAAASTQYIIDRWEPDYLINLGTCGGFQGEIDKGAIILVSKTIIYDIVEKMGDPDEALDYYTTFLDLNWLTEDYPQEIMKTTLISADRDLDPEEIPALRNKFGAVAGDWESGAIAYIASLNGTKCLILRGVTDIVGTVGGEADEDIDIFIHNTREVLEKLVNALPDWLGLFEASRINIDVS